MRDPVPSEIPRSEGHDRIYNLPPGGLPRIHRADVAAQSQDRIVSSAGLLRHPVRVPHEAACGGRHGTRYLDAVGARLDNEDSLLYQCHKNNVPIVVPGITDGSFGCQLWMYYQTHRKLRIDLFGDEQMLSEMTNDAEYTGAIIIGGGISKHHVIWWNQFRGGLDYCIYLTTAEEYDGSLSGARIREAVSWGKVKEDARKMTVEGDATITLPIIYAGVANRVL